MKRIIAFLVCFSLLISAAIVFAEIKSLVKEYTYQASELDSKTSCRAIALEQVKRELLEELGSYIESTTVVQNAQIEKDEIKTISAGIVQTKILAENWDGKYFWIKAEVSADPNEVAASIEKVRNDQKLSEELAESQAEKEEALQEVDRLKAELSKSNADKEKLAQYNQAVNKLQASDSFEEGTAMTVAGDYEGATKAYDRVIYLRPEDPKAYFGRSIVYIYLGNYSRATQDLDRAMVIRPANTNVYFQRASAYKSIREARLNDPNWRPFPGQPRRPLVPIPKQDPLKTYLDNKQNQHKLVKVNPFQPRPVIKRDPRQVPPRKLQQKPEKPIAGQPVRPNVYRKGDVRQPTSLDRKSSVIAPRVDDEPRSIQKRNLNEEQKRVWQQRKKEQGEQKNLEKQQRQDLRKKEGSVVRQTSRPEVRRQANVPPPNQPRVERKPPIAQPRIERVQKKEIKEEKKNLKQRKKDEDDEKPSRR
jgi:tetratricopeptide (TPR) repeat protein